MTTGTIAERRRARDRKKSRRAYKDGSKARRLARQLSAGVQIKNESAHHLGMAEWKTQLGDPRPAGLSLSRTCPAECPDGYGGYWVPAAGEKRDYRLCGSPAHYIWETIEANNARRRQPRAGPKPLGSWAAVPQSVRDTLRQHVFERDGWHCRIRLAGICRHLSRDACKGCAEELDHIVPRGMGGAVMDPSNCRAACYPCNRARAGGKRKWHRKALREW